MNINKLLNKEIANKHKIMNNKIDNGNYKDDFFTKHEIDLVSDYHMQDSVYYDYELIADYCEYVLKYEFEDESDKVDQVEQFFWESLTYRTTYFEPMIFNAEVALDCDLIPFTYEGKNLLALRGCGMDLTSRLDAYQLLVDNSVDKNSRLLKSNNDDYLESVLDAELLQKVRRILSDKVIVDRKR